MPSTIFGIPLHPLLVHATVVMVPLAAMLVILAVLVPRFRIWAGVLPAATSLVALILTPLSTGSGENLQNSVVETNLIEEHAELGNQLLFFTIPLFIFAAAFWYFTRKSTESAFKSGQTLIMIIGVLAVIASIGTGVQVGRIGHSGAKASWSNTGAAGSGG